MKKILFYFVFLCSFVPLASQAEKFLNLNESFTVARAVKLGRSSAVSSQTIAIQNTGTISMIKECDPNCANCNKVSGVCNSCTSSRYLSNNLCLYCPGNATCNGVSFSCRAGYYKNGQSCSLCSANTYSTEGATYCSSCPSGSFSNAGASSCIPIPPNCSSYTSSGSCTKCNSGYYLSGGSCYAEKSCSTGCTSCDKTTGNCLSCSPERFLKDNSCLICPGNATCNGKTFTCNSGYTENDTHNGCTVSCSASSYYSETETYYGSHCIPCGYKHGPCSKCNAEKCLVCYAGYTADLTSCPEGYTLSTYSNCGRCIPKSCPSGYTAGKEDCSNEELEKADYDFISNGTDGSGRICGKCVEKSCPTGYTRVYTNDNTCNPPSSYTRADQGPNIKCMKCSTPTCGKYPNCCSGQWQFDKTCLNCDPNAATCSGSTMTCKPGYVLKGGHVCAKCDSSCKTCYDVGPVYCSSCPSGKRLSGGRCI